MPERMTYTGKNPELTLQRFLEGKRCRTCGEHKPSSEWSRCKTAPDGLAGLCKPCHVASNNKTYARRGMTAGEYYNAGARKLGFNSWSNRYKNMYGRRTRARQSLPAMFMPWGQGGVHGEGHVDHVVPIAGWCVSGLDVVDNKQLLSAEANGAKSNGIDQALMTRLGYHGLVLDKLDLPLAARQWMALQRKTLKRLSYTAVKTLPLQERRAWVVNAISAWMTANPPPELRNANGDVANA